VTKRHALIVEDDLSNIEVLKMLLLNQDFYCTTISDSRSLEKTIDQADPIDVVFLDLKMPSINGYEVFQFLKHKRCITAPIIAYSVYANEMAEARKVGFDGFLVKPVEIKNFPDQLKRILNREPLW
jgi:CheY-like chemotaxis protein